MSRFVAIPVLVVVLLPSTTFAQFGGMGGPGGGRGGMGGASGHPHRRGQARSGLVKAETVGGKSVSGTLALVSVPVNCDLGRYHIRPENIKAIRFTTPNNQQPMGSPEGMSVPGAVATRSGEEIDGNLIVVNWTVETDLGQVTLNPTKLKALTFNGLAKVEPPANKAEQPAQKK